MKKLEEKYECIDKWKKKYIPEYPDVLKNKLSLDSSRNSIELIHSSPTVSEKQSQKERVNLPSIAQISPPLASPIDQGKRL